VVNDDSSSGRFNSIGQALVRTAHDPTEFEALVAAIMDAGRGEDSQLEGIRALVKEVMPAAGVGAADTGRASIRAYLESLPYPAVAVTRAGSILAHNGPAETLFAIESGGDLRQIGIDRGAFSRFLDRLDRAPEAGSLLIAERAEEGRTLALWGALDPHCGAIRLSPASTPWSVALADILRAEFGLSTRELSVARALGLGRSAAEVARTDGRTEGTIRQTIKAVLAKLGVNSQARAVALLATLSSSLSRLDAVDTAAPARVGADMRILHDRLGRKVGLHRYGEPGGLPVLMVHGALYGIGTLPAERAIASAMGLAILACERPGYGVTVPCGVRNDLIQTAVDDMVLALDHERIERVVVVAHDTGFVHAAALAAHLPERVAGIVAVSPAIPMRTAEQVAGMPVQQQVFAWAARNAPWLVEVLTRIGVKRMRKLGAAGWPHAVFAGVPVDMAVACRADVLPAVAAAYTFNTAQAALGFQLDVTVANSDWSEMLETLSCPVHILHGSENRTIPLDKVRTLAEGNPRIILDAIAGAGHTLAMDRPELSLRRAFAQTLEFRSTT